MVRIALVGVATLFIAGSGVASAGQHKPIPAEAWPEQEFVVEISPAVRLERATIIRDTAASLGMTNAVLLAGIGEVETNFSHCWSEATWACQGPNSSSCGGGPVIAGSADGPCGNEQGGLGLFQFDSGTYSQTIATYGATIVTMDGNVNAVVPFLVTRAIQSVAGVNSEQEAIDWMNSIPIVDGDPLFEDWLYFVAWRFNGCQGCTTQQNKYRAGTHALLSEMGPEFWAAESGPVGPTNCLSIPADGRRMLGDDDCFVLYGAAQFWRDESNTNGEPYVWTMTTDNVSASNYGIWNLIFQEPGKYRIEVLTEGAFAQSEQAAYELTHADGDATVMVDQRAANGWTVLGSYNFFDGTRYPIRLNDNTGEVNPAVELVYDSIRVIREDDDGGGGGGGEGSDAGMGPGEKDTSGLSGCGCSSSDSQSSLWFLFLGVLYLLRRPRFSER